VKVRTAAALLVCVACAGNRPNLDLKKFTHANTMFVMLSNPFVTVTTPWQLASSTLPVKSTHEASAAAFTAPARFQPYLTPLLPVCCPEPTGCTCTAQPA
jgi:hypothetical protein